MPLKFLKFEQDPCRDDKMAQHNPNGVGLGPGGFGFFKLEPVPRSGWICVK